MTNRTSAKVVLDSISEAGHRLTTLEVVMHPSAVEHFLTHRALSRNGASKRAIPLRKQIEAVREDPCYPASWKREQPGMQGGDELPARELYLAQNAWLRARGRATVEARLMGEAGLHKETASRVLAPFQWRTYLVSATEWTGFLQQRCSPLAQADIRLVAEAVRDALEASRPTLLEDWQWHLPYIDGENDWDELEERKISAARCARVSYLTHAGVRDHRADLELADRLLSADPPHWSPFEHVARPYDGAIADKTANFRGWEQWRTVLGG